jgi:hypothetical protein
MDPALQAGITENLVFKHLHEDAEHLYNTTMSLHAVVTQLTDPNKRLARKVSGASYRCVVICLRQIGFVSFLAAQATPTNNRSQIVKKQEKCARRHCS